MVRRAAPASRQPGSTADTERSDDAALEAGQQGKTHKVSKHPDPATLPKSQVQGDPERPGDTPVNTKPEMKYADAMRLLDEGKLKRSVLTDQGWVTVAKAAPAGSRP